MDIFAELVDHILVHLRIDSCIPEKIEGRAWCRLGKIWELIIMCFHHLQVCVKHIIKFHRKLSCHLITLWSYIFMVLHLHGVYILNDPKPQYLYTIQLSILRLHCSLKDYHNQLATQKQGNTISMVWQYSHLFLTFQKTHWSQTFYCLIKLEG